MDVLSSNGVIAGSPSLSLTPHYGPGGRQRRRRDLRRRRSAHRAIDRPAVAPDQRAEQFCGEASPLEFQDRHAGPEVRGDLGHAAQLAAREHLLLPDPDAVLEEPRLLADLEAGSDAAP